jgi:hypothetical protein
MKKESRKARVNFSLDKDLYKKMQFYSEKIGVNWSQLIEQALLPVVLTFDEIFKQVERSGEKDLTKVKMFFQKLIVDTMGKAYSSYEAIEKDLDKMEVRPTGQIDYSKSEKSSKEPKTVKARMRRK